MSQHSFVSQPGCEALPWDKRVIVGIVLAWVLPVYPLFLLGQMACRNWMDWLNCSLCNEKEMAIGAVVFGLSFVIFLWWGAKPFTGAVTNRKLSQLIQVCYIFTFLLSHFHSAVREHVIFSNVATDSDLESD